MNLAKISASEQITMPTMASSQAIYKAQKALEGVAEQMGVYSEDDIQTLVDEIRYGKENR